MAMLDTALRFVLRLRDRQKRSTPGCRAKDRLPALSGAGLPALLWVLEATRLKGEPETDLPSLATNWPVIAAVSTKTKDAYRGKAKASGAPA